MSRVSENRDIDLSGNWNATDIRIASDNLLKSCLKDGWIKKHRWKKPVVIVGVVENRSSEHIDTRILTDALESGLLESGKVIASVDSSDRYQLSAERDYQAENASKKTRKESGNETGADYLLTGNISTNLDREGKHHVRTYYINMELIDIESGLKVWKDQQVIKKDIRKNHYKF